MTETMAVGEGMACVFVVIDYYNSKCIGVHAAKSGNRFEASEPIRQGVRRHCGDFGAMMAARLSLRQDHASNYMSHDFQAEIAFLGIESSPSCHLSVSHFLPYIAVQRRAHVLHIVGSQETDRWQGSPSFVREPEGNGVAERFLRKLKDNFLWVHTFDPIEDLRQGLIAFAEASHQNWLVARHGYRTPAEVRTSQVST